MYYMYYILKGIYKSVLAANKALFHLLYMSLIILFTTCTSKCGNHSRSDAIKYRIRNLIDKQCGCLISISIIIINIFSRPISISVIIIKISFKTACQSVQATDHEKQVVWPLCRVQGGCQISIGERFNRKNTVEGWFFLHYIFGEYSKKKGNLLVFTWVLL